MWFAMHIRSVAMRLRVGKIWLGLELGGDGESPWSGICLEPLGGWSCHCQIAKRQGLGRKSKCGMLLRSP